MPINAPLLRKIADQIEREPERYDQENFEVMKDCGTAHCIGGWAIALEGFVIDRFWDENYQHAAELLGLSKEYRDRLFRWSWVPRPGLTVPQALRLIADGASVESVSA